MFHIRHTARAIYGSLVNALGPCWCEARNKFYGTRHLTHREWIANIQRMDIDKSWGQYTWQSTGSYLSMELYESKYLFVILECGFEAFEDHEYLVGAQNDSISWCHRRWCNQADRSE
jgi:hypothetical protein